MSKTLNAVRAPVLLAILLNLVACGGAGPADTASPTAGAPGPATGQLSIDLPTSVGVVVGRSLSIESELSGNVSGPVTYSIENGPPWLSVDPATGTLTGTPTAADIGTYERIRIIASDGGSQSSAFITINVTMTAAGRATVAWQAPTERTDGSPLTDLAGFRIYYGESRGSLQYVIDVADPGARNWVVTDLTPGTWYFAATAYDTAGAESSRSNVASKFIA